MKRWDAGFAANGSGRLHFRILSVRVGGSPSFGVNCIDVWQHILMLSMISVGGMVAIRRFFVANSLLTRKKTPMSTTHDLLSVIRRRPVGKGAWKMTITELIESERTSLQHLRAIGNRYPGDADLQRFVAQATAEAAERLIRLNELLHYRGEKESCGGCP